SLVDALGRRRDDATRPAGRAINSSSAAVDRLREAGMRGHRFIAAWLALAVVVGVTVSVHAEPLKLRVGWAVVPSQLTSIIFMKKDILKHYGTSYSFEPVKFRGSAPQITALAAGELDLAALAFSSVGLAIQNAHMDDIRVV